MKKLILTAVIAIFGFTTAQAQEGGFGIGISAGLPMGDMDDRSSFNLSLDAGYLMNVADSFQVGGMVGYTHFFGKEYEFLGSTVEKRDFQWLPIAGSARFFASEDFFFGADLGYALGMGDTEDGGFYYRPKVGYNLGAARLILSYTGISISDPSFTANSLNVGVEFGF